MNPIDENISNYALKSLETAKVGNSWGLFGQRKITINDKNEFPNNYPIDDEFFKKFLDHCPNLTSLSLNVSRIKQESFEELIKKMPHLLFLEIIEMSFPLNLKSENLEILGIHNCNFDDYKKSKLDLKSLPIVHTLDLSKNKKVTHWFDFSIENTKIKNINFSDSNIYNLPSLDELMALETIDISNCEQLNPKNLLDAVGFYISREQFGKAFDLLDGKKLSEFLRSSKSYLYFGNWKKGQHYSNNNINIDIKMLYLKELIIENKNSILKHLIIHNDFEDAIYFYHQLVKEEVATYKETALLRDEAMTLLSDPTYAKRVSLAYNVLIDIGDIRGDDLNGDDPLIQLARAIADLEPNDDA